MIISLINFKGGVGKTTSAILFASVIKDNTLLVDASQESNLTAYYRLDPQIATHHNLYSYITKADSTAAIAIDDRLTIIPASMRTFQSGVALKKLPPYPVTIIDTQPAFSTFVQSIILLTDVIVIPCDMSQWAFETAMTVAKQVRNFRKDVLCFILPTKYKWWWPRDKWLIRQFKAHIEKQGICTILPKVRFAISASDIALSSGKLSRRLKKDYTNIWRLICQTYETHTKNR